MASFDVAVKVVMQEEGGLSNNPLDPGGQTRFGISHKSFPLVDIATLTLQQAEDIIKENYWRFDEVNAQEIATKLLDMAVNLGLGTAIRLLQTALTVLGVPTTTDGCWGPNTLATCNGSHSDQLLIELRTQQQHHYVSLVANNPSLYPFLKGWLRRANQV